MTALKMPWDAVSYLTAWRNKTLHNKNLLACGWWQCERCKGNAYRSHRSLQLLASARPCWQVRRVVFSPKGGWAQMQECGHSWLVLEKNPAGTCLLCCIVVVGGWGQRACERSLASLWHSRAIPCVGCTMTSFFVLTPHTKPHWCRILKKNPHYI